MISKAFFIPSVLLVSALVPASAAIVLSGDFINGTTTPTLTITDDIVFNITVGGDARVIVFDEWTTSDNNNIYLFADSGQSLSYDIDGTGGTVPLQVLVEDASYNYGDVTKNDGTLGFNPLTVSAGQTFTIKAGSYTYQSDVDFNPLLIDTVFTGNVFIADDDREYLSNIVTVPVPEPSALLLFALGVVPLLRRRR
ncbi:PEP-CTERM sorting domain-containing protein [Luteolibacter sp. AS25]|uniref:PEP-CTERM sorting domain-containing protein n=1 Tax=Luteolibacter sp. AS25 TaxID=3135776 RepID=UPI00398A94B2